MLRASHIPALAVALSLAMQLPTYGAAAAPGWACFCYDPMELQLRRNVAGTIRAL